MPSSRPRVDRRLQHLAEWFAPYAGGHLQRQPGDINIIFKIQHTARVRENAAVLAHLLHLDAESAVLAEAIGLLHDTGRFPQYERYATFLDSASCNHGQLGAQVLAEEGVLQVFTERQQHIILEAVRYHNAFCIPDLQDEELIHHLRIIRDADKIDVLDVLAEHFETPREQRSPVLDLGMPDDPFISPEALEQIRRKQPVKLAQMKHLNDFKLVNISWVYDMNFAPTCEVVLDRQYIERIAATLPQSAELDAVVAGVLADARAKASSAGQ